VSAAAHRLPACVKNRDELLEAIYAALTESYQRASEGALAQASSLCLRKKKHWKPVPTGEQGTLAGHGAGFMSQYWQRVFEALMR
jgi:hypothetical protein